MASFNDLPLELVQMVAGYVTPDDIVSFAMVNRYTLHGSGDRLKEHVELKKKYTNRGYVFPAGIVADAESTIDSHFADIPSYLLQFSHNWKIPFYIQSLKRAWFYKRNDPTNIEERLRLIKENNGFRHLFEACPYIPQSDVDKYHNAVMTGDEEPLLGLLLFLLPNLKNVELGHGMGITYTMWMLRDAAAILRNPVSDGANSAGQAKFARRPLEQLEICDLEGLRSVNAMLSVPFPSTLRSLSCGFSDHCPTKFDASSPNIQNLKGLTTFKVRDWPSTASNLSKLLVQMESLEVFDYNFQEYSVGCDCGCMGPRQHVLFVYRALKTTSRTSLRTIRLDLCAGQDLAFAKKWSFKDFPILTKLTLSIFLMASPEGSQKKLWDRLPSCLEELTVTGPGEEVELLEEEIMDLTNSLLEGFTKNYKKSLPRLRILQWVGMLVDPEARVHSIHIKTDLTGRASDDYCCSYEEFMEEIGDDDSDLLAYDSDLEEDDTASKEANPQNSTQNPAKTENGDSGVQVAVGEIEGGGEQATSVPASTNPSKAKKDKTDDDEFEVEEIVDSRRYRRQLQYRVKWRGYGDEGANDWHPARNFEHAGDAVRDFHAKNPEKPGP